MNSVDVAIADDHPLVCAALRRLLGGDGRFRIAVEASSPEALLEALARTRCAIVVTDFSMPSARPGDDGFKLLRRLAMLGHRPAVVVLTMITHPAALRHMTRVGVRALVSKEDGLGEVVSACAAMLLPGTRYRSPAVRRQLAGEARGPVGRDALTLREIEVVRLLAQGHSLAEIATLVHRSRSTVVGHRRHAMRKVGAGVTAELIRYAYEKGLT